MTFDPTDREEEAASSIVEEALAGLGALLPPDLLAEIRASLLDRLTIDPDGRRLLRAAMPDPVVDESGDVARAAGAGTDAHTKSRAG